MSTNISADCNNTNNIENDLSVSAKANEQNVSQEIKTNLSSKKQQKDRINKKINQRMIKKSDINLIYDKVSDEYLIKNTADDPAKLQNTPILTRQAQKYYNYC